MDPRTAGLGQPAALRRHNLSSLLREVHVHGALSRSELASRTGLNRSTIGSLVAELASRRLVAERPPGDKAGPGRPSPLVAPLLDGPVVLAAEMATDSLAVAVVALGGTILHSARMARPRGMRSPDAEVTALGQLASGPLGALGGGQPVLAVAVAVPGLVRRDDGFVLLAPNLGWRNVPIADLVAAELALDVPVFVGNDADLATLAEHTRGAGVGQSDFLCLWGEAGIGAGIIAGGQQIGGSVGYAGEVGHMTVNPDGLPCHCGSRGCWETEAGEEALIRLAGGGPGGDARASVDQLLAAAAAGDPEALRAVTTVGHWLGIGIAGLVNVFNPGTIALGGLYARLFPFVRAIIVDEVAHRTIARPHDLVAIVRVSLGADAALVGAAELAFAPTIADPATVSRVGARRARPVAAMAALGGRAVEQSQGGELAAQRTA